MAREAALNSCLVQSVLNSPHVPEHLLCYLYAKKNCFCATIQCREKFRPEQHIGIIWIT